MNSRQPKYFLAVAIGVAAALFGGCTTKNYVRQQTTPLVNRVNDLDAQTAKNTNAIKSVQAQAQSGIAAANATSAQATQQAQSADANATRVAGQLDQSSHQIQSLSSTLANVDDYQMNYQTAIHFAFNKWNLTAESDSILDDVVNRLQQDSHAILEVQGYTDAIGPAAYNYQLSDWRADSVVRYLEDKGIPPHRIFLIGLGKNQFVATNATRAGRSQNRRVDLKVLVNSLAKSASQAMSQQTSQPQQ